MQRKALKHFFLDNFWFLILLVLGGLSWSVTMVKSGLLSDFGLGFWGANGHDGIWHISLINSLSKGSFNSPVFAGELLKNYHIGFDLLVSFLHRITFIPVSALYFQILPPLIAVLVGILVYLFVWQIKKSKKASLWAVFFVYFGGDLGWLVTFLREGKLGGESLFWSQQSISTLINPPFALSLVLIFAGLIFFFKRKLFLAILFFGLLALVKIYASVLILISLFLISLFQILKSKNLFSLKVFIGSLILSLILFIPLNQTSTNLLVFKPFWFLETLFSPDRLNWPKFYSAIMNYQLAGNLKAVPAYLVALTIFWIGNMSTRLLKEIQVFKWLKNPGQIKSFDVFIISMIAFGVLLPMLFLQKGTSWNTIQFFYYSLIFSGILAGIGVSNIKIKSPKVSFLLSLIIVLLTIPTSISTLNNVYLPSRAPAKLSQAELEALKFLKKEEKGVVLTYPFNKDKAKEAEKNPPRPLYLYESTAYVSAFSSQPSFLEDEINLEITGYDWKMRKNKIEEFFNTENKNLARDFLKMNNIKYIYLVKEQRLFLNEAELGIKKMFENQEARIFKVE